MRILTLRPAFLLSSIIFSSSLSVNGFFIRPAYCDPIRAAPLFRHLQHVREQQQHPGFSLSCGSALRSNNNNNNDPKKEEGRFSGGGLFSFLFNPYESNIPDEIRKDIYEAEAKTPAARDRTQRVVLYSFIAFTGILCAFFNGFLTELRTLSDGTSGSLDLLDDAGFGWVTDNFLLQFLFTNRLGGILSLLLGGGAGLLAEAEFDTKRINAEKIFDEMQRRRSERKQTSSSRTKKKKQRSNKMKKKRRSGSKEAKRLSALSEVVAEQEEEEERQRMAVPETVLATNKVGEAIDKKADKTKPELLEKKDGDETGGGIFGKVKNFYDRADSMAASQALLLNKKLEDAGVVEKITDESGLKVIGKDAAAKLQEEEKETGTTQPKKKKD